MYERWQELMSAPDAAMAERSRAARATLRDAARTASAP
jgi:hypothetical protein